MEKKKKKITKPTPKRAKPLGKGLPVSKCWNCDKYIETRYVNYARNERDHYCSQNCWIVAHPRVTRACLNCEKEWEATAGDLAHNAHKYCSRECYREHTRAGNQAQLVCENCGKDFTLPKSVLKHNSGRFCTRDCYKEFIRGRKRGPYKKRSKDA